MHGTTSEEFIDKASSTIDQARATASSMANDAAEKGRMAGKQIEAVAGNMKGAIDRSISEQPMTTLAIAAAFGFVLGAIWKS